MRTTLFYHTNVFYDLQRYHMYCNTVCMASILSMNIIILIYYLLFLNPILLRFILCHLMLIVNQRMTKKVVLKEYCAEIEMLKSQLQITREKNG
jgi:hypothetical protein